MEISFRDMITVLHGMGFGALFIATDAILEVRYTVEVTLVITAFESGASTIGMRAKISIIC